MCQYEVAQTILGVNISTDTRRYSRAAKREIALAEYVPLTESLDIE